MIRQDDKYLTRGRIEYNMYNPNSYRFVFQMVISGLRIPVVIVFYGWTRYISGLEQLFVL